MSESNRDRAAPCESSRPAGIDAGFVVPAVEEDPCRESARLLGLVRAVVEASPRRRRDLARDAEMSEEELEAVLRDDGTSFTVESWFRILEAAGVSRNCFFAWVYDLEEEDDARDVDDGSTHVPERS